MVLALCALGVQAAVTGVYILVSNPSNNQRQELVEVEHDGSMSEADRESIAEMLSSRVADTGLSAQVGLRNVKQRLELLYGEKGSLRVEQCGPDRILASVRFPTQ